MLARSFNNMNYDLIIVLVHKTSLLALYNIIQVQPNILKWGVL